MALILGLDHLLVTQKAITFRTTTVATSAYAQYADTLKTFLGTWIDDDFIQIGDKFLGKFASEKTAALIKPAERRKDRFTNETSLKSHAFTIFLFYGDLRQLNRFETVADLNEAVVEALDKNIEDFNAIAGHADTRAEFIQQLDELTIGFKRIDGVIEVTFTQEI